MDGILLVDKPADWTSHDVVAKVRSLLRRRVASGQLLVDSKKLKTNNYKLKTTKVGHTGTLDPMATGLLVLVLGSYTKRAAEFSKLDKTYEAELTLGATSTTGDSEGEITAHSGKRKAKREELERLLHSLTGEISQTPPQFSAVKLGGQRAYSLARRGKEVKLEPRQVTVYELRVMSYEYPKLQIKTRVSSGTYIRSLAADIGQALGTGAYLSALRRTSVGEFDIKKALNLDELSLTSLKTNLIR